MRAVWRSLGTSLPTEGPGLSARIRLMWLPPLRGTTARTNTKTPMPPTQWVKLRQNRETWLSASTSLRMLAPVVVKPETTSNMASVNRGISPVNTKGRQPTALMMIQHRAVLTQPSFR